MSTKYGSNYTDRFQTKPVVPVDASNYGGNVKAMYDEYTLAAALSTGDVLKMGRLPKGAKVLEVILASADLDSSTNCLLDVGLSYPNGDGTDDDNAFLASVNAQSAVTKAMSAQNNMTGFGLETEGEADVEVKVQVAGDATSGKIKCLVLYSTNQ